MNFTISIKLILLLVLISSMSSCYKLQPDEELEQDIIGVWHKTDCKYPNTINPQNYTGSSPLAVEMTFYPDSRFSEDNHQFDGFCVLDTNQGGECTCTWMIENGALIIVPNAPSYTPLHVLHEFPLLSLHDDCLVFDNAELRHQGTVLKLKKTCYERQ